VGLGARDPARDALAERAVEGERLPERRMPKSEEEEPRLAMPSGSGMPSSSA
jgi:hypothetical protein